MVVEHAFLPAFAHRLEVRPKLGVRPVLIEHGSAHLTMGGGARRPRRGGVRSTSSRASSGARTRAGLRGVERGCRWLRHFGIESSGVLNNSIDAGASDPFHRGVISEASWGWARRPPRLVRRTPGSREGRGVPARRRARVGEASTFASSSRGRPVARGGRRVRLRQRVLRRAPLARGGRIGAVDWRRTRFACPAARRVSPPRCWSARRAPPCPSSRMWAASKS